MSPYEDTYVDKIAGYVTVTVDKGQGFICWCVGLIYLSVSLHLLMFVFGFCGLCRVSKMASLLSCFWFCFIAIGTSGQQLGSLIL